MKLFIVQKSAILSNQKLTHVTRRGETRMVDVSSKEITHRVAVAYGAIKLTPAIAKAIRANGVAKGNVFETARIAAIQAVKKTSDLIPLCHPLPISHISVQFALKRNAVQITAEVSADAKTGVEMEALTAVAVAGLVIYDMCKGIDKGMVIGPIKLLYKSGGKSGEYKKSIRDTRRD